MKKLLLSIFFLIFVHIIYAQNVKIIQASERSNSRGAVIIPPPANIRLAPAVPAARDKSKSSEVSKSEHKKKAVKEVRCCNEKKSCVKKICTPQKNSSSPAKNKSVESAKK